jgi:hypothetical protein
VLGGHRGCVCSVLLTLGCLPLPVEYPFGRRYANSIVMIVCSIPVGCAIDRTSNWGEALTVRSRKWG